MSGAPTSTAGAVAAVGDAVAGTELPAFRTPPLDSVRIRMFSEATRDPNPMHLDPEFARRVGMPDVIAQGGVAVVALTHLVALWGGRDAIDEVDVKFRAPVLCGEELVCAGSVTAVGDERIEVACRATNAEGATRAEGTVWLRR